MFRNVILAIVSVVLVCQLLGFLDEASAQSVERLDRTESFWVQLWNWLKEHTFLFSIIIVTALTIFSTMMATLRRDRLLKSLAGQLITIELKGDEDEDGVDRRYRGRLRVESEGLEVVAERVGEDLEKVSYLLRKDEYGLIHALVRYHDFLTDREKEAREAEVDRVYHPSIGMRLRRKSRNIVNEMRRVATEAFTLVFGKVRKSFNLEAAGGGEYGSQLEEAGQEAVSYATEAAYDTLIDKLIGTRVVAWINEDLEYVGVLKDYTRDFIELLDVDYENEWEVAIEREDRVEHERGIVLRKDGDDIVIQSKSPFEVTLNTIRWEGDRPEAEREDIDETIEPFGEARLNLMPPVLEVEVPSFDELRLSERYHYQAYEEIIFEFSSVRVTDIVMLKNYGIVRHRMEKYDARLLDYGALADALLTNKGGELELEGELESTPLIVHNGYLTNLPRERMDFVELDGQLSKRWEVDRSFANLDKKLRPVSKHYFLRLLPLRKARRVLALFALMMTLYSDENRGKDPILLFHIAFALCNTNRRTKRRSYKQEVLIKKKRRLFKLLLANFSRLRPSRTRRATPTSAEE